MSATSAGKIDDQEKTLVFYLVHHDRAEFSLKKTLAMENWKRLRDKMRRWHFDVDWISNVSWPEDQTRRGCVKLGRTPTSEEALAAFEDLEAIFEVIISGEVLKIDASDVMEGIFNHEKKLGKSRPAELESIALKSKALAPESIILDVQDAFNDGVKHLIGLRRRLESAQDEVGKAAAALLTAEAGLAERAAWLEKQNEPGTDAKDWYAEAGLERP